MPWIHCCMQNRLCRWNRCPIRTTSVWIRPKVCRICSICSKYKRRNWNCSLYKRKKSISMKLRWPRIDTIDGTFILNINVFITGGKWRKRKWGILVVKVDQSACFFGLIIFVIIRSRFVDVLKVCNFCLLVDRTVIFFAVCGTEIVLFIFFKFWYNLWMYATASVFYLIQLRVILRQM